VVRTAALVAAAGCTSDGAAGPAIRPRVAVFAVLNPARAEQVVLVEQTGRRPVSVDPEAGASALLDPIVASGGTPLRDAQVVLHDARGDSVVAVEDAVSRGDGRGQGVYRFANRAGTGALAILPGATYELRVTTALGTARATTTVPAAATLVADSANRTVQLGQTLTIPPRAGAAAALLVTSDSPDAEQAVVDDPTVALYGARDCPTLGERVQAGEPTVCFRLTYPGFTQQLSVAAVDSNYRSYLRARRDPFGTADETNSIVGGVGVFGSVVPRLIRRISVVTPFARPIEGRWVSDAAPDPLPTTLTLYSLFGVQAPSGVALAVSGNHRDRAGELRGGVLGSLSDSTLSLVVLPGMRASATGAALELRFDGQTLRALAADRATVLAVYRRR
jgi:hypothetical protein